MAAEDKCEKDPNCEHKIPVAGVICVRPIYVFGTLVATPPTYFQLGRGYTYNADACDSDADQMHDDGLEDGGASIKECFQPQSHENDGADCRNVSRRKPNRSDSDKVINAEEKEAKPYKTPCGWWMQTTDGRACDDPGFISFSDRRLHPDGQSKK